MRCWLYKHLGIFKNTREVREALGASLCTSRVFLKISACLYNSAMHSGAFFISLIKNVATALYNISDNT